MDNMKEGLQEERQQEQIENRQERLAGRAAAEALNRFLDAVNEVIDIFREAEYDAERAAEDALTTEAFVVTESGDAPVHVSEIVPADLHVELLAQYATAGYKATPVTIRKRNLDAMAAAKAKKEAAAAGK